MTQLLQNAVYGGVMILAVAALRQVLKDRLIPEARLALWAVCLFRLLTPAVPESVLSLWGLGRRLGQGAQAVPAPVPAAPGVGGAMVPAPPATAVPAPAPAEIPWGQLLTAVWVLAGAALAVRFALSYARTRRAVGCAVPLERDDPRYALLPKCARLREGPVEGAPLTFGALRPTVVLSPGLSGEELACVLAHEGVHARRRDNLWHYVMALALAAHWWNPAVWLMARLLRQDIELSCDRAAVKRLGADRRAEYAQALVSLATQSSGPAFCQTFGRKSAEERILSVMKYKKTTIIGAALTLTLVLAVTVGFASNPAAQAPDGTVEFHGRTYNRAELSQETLDWLDWYLSLSEEGQRSVSMVPPELIDGLAAGAGDADVGDTGIRTEQGEKSPVDTTRQVSLDEYKALLDRLVAEGKVSREDADWLFAGAKQALEQAEKNGQVLVIQTNDTGSYAMMPAPICTLPNCGNTGVHTHDGVTYSSWLGKYSAPPFGCTDEACAGLGPHWHEDGEIIHFYYAYSAAPIGEPGFNYDPRVADSAGGGPNFPATACPVDGCTEILAHQHDGLWYCFLHPVCPVEGCTMTGEHVHDGVAYSCNGAHCGGVCDGSCYAPSGGGDPAAPAAGGHHSGESGHHGSGHH